MERRRVANPKVLLPLAALALVGSSAVAVFVAAGYTPDPGPGEVPASPIITETSTFTVPAQPPPPPIMLPPPMPQVPCMGWTDEGCEPPPPAR